MEKLSVLSLILLRGDDNKHRHLLVEFEEFDRANEEKHAKVEYHSFKNKTDIITRKALPYFEQCFYVLCTSISLP